MKIGFLCGVALLLAGCNYSFKEDQIIDARTDIETDTGTGSGDTGSDTGSQDTGSDTGSQDTGSDTGIDSGSEDTGSDTGSQDTGSGDTGSDTGSNDTGSIDTETGDTGTEIGVQYFNDGPIADDPFGDGSEFGYIFKYDQSLYIGSNDSATGAIKANGDGSSPESVTFSIVKDVIALNGGTHLNTAPGPFTTFLGAGAPDLEDARGVFSSGIIDGVNYLFYNGIKIDGNLDYFYYTSDTDNVLNWSYFDMTVSTAGGTKGVVSQFVFNDRLYLGMTDSGGKNPKSPRLVVALDLSQQDGVSNGNALACEPGVHSSCSLSGDLMPYIGVNNASPSPAKANPASVVGIDSMTVYNDALYIANNGGVIRSANTTPLDYLNSSEHWDRTPALNFEAQEPAHRTNTIRLTRVNDLTRRELGYPQMAVYRNNLYIIRNGCAVAATNATYPSLSCSVANMKPQLWRFDGTTWTAMVQEAGITNFGNQYNNYITMIVRNGGTDDFGGVLYVGFDNDSDGIAVYKTVEDDPSMIEAWTGLDDVVCSGSCMPMANYGFGTVGADRLTQIMDGISIRFSGADYLYVTAGNSTGTPLKVYRSLD